MQPNHVVTIAEPVSAEFKDKGSRFIAYAYPIVRREDVKPLLDILRQQHHKARHLCFAWRLGVDGQQFRANDDGEPAGSAGRPILGQIDSAGVSDVLVVVVRYFGGTLLGVPGLINAYKTATERALQVAVKLHKELVEVFELTCDYAALSEVLRYVKKLQVAVLHRDLNSVCCLTLAVPLKWRADYLKFWTKIPSVRFETKQ